MSSKQQTPEAIARNGELLREPGALDLVGKFLDGEMTGEDAVKAAVSQEIGRLMEAGLEETDAYGKVLLKLALQGPGLVPALLCGTRENDEAVDLALEETRQMMTRGKRRRRR